MVKLYKVTLKVNGITRTCEIIGKEPNFFQYKSRIERALNLGKKDIIDEKSVQFECIKNYLGL